MTRVRWSSWRVLLLGINVASTLFTLLTGFKENPLVVFATDKYGLVRSRLRDGRINYDLVRDDLVDIGALANLSYAGNHFRFISAPERSPSNLAEDRSTCMRVTSINTSVLAMHYNDFWGKGPRRIQIVLHSISAPRCKVVNFRPEWVASCMQTYSNASAFHRHIFDNFEDLQENRVIQVGVENDFGVVGVPFLKCLSRPERSFDYVTDLMVQQCFWAGGSFHLEIQSSKCYAVPLFRNNDMKWGLFQVEAADQAAEVVVGINSSGWFASFVCIAHGVISVVMICQGIVAAMLRSKAVLYLPKSLRFLNEYRHLRHIAPSMSLVTMLVGDENSVIRFKGSLLTGSDYWLNLWPYITLSTLEALVNIRLTYVVYEMGTWMLKKHTNMENFIFTCSALTRMTWIMCFIHAMLRLGTKVALRSLKTTKLLRSETRQKIEWYMDASALFLGFKVCSLLLCVFLYAFHHLHGSTTFMVQQVPFKTGVFGGSPGIAKFWKSEIMCDYFVILSILTLCGLVVGSLMLSTKYRFAANNELVRLLQQRYVFVGWDIFVVMEALGIDPFNPKLVENEVATTSCSIGCVLQQLYVSGPSGLVQLAGDYIFLDGGFSKEPLTFAYPTKKAVRMGFVQSKGTSTTSTKPAKYTIQASPDDVKITTHIKANANNTQVRKSIYDQHLRIFIEARFGKILLVDQGEPGKYHTNSAGFIEYVVHDALTTMCILGIKHLLGNEKKLRIS
ncbi:hypothetical protein FI667_g15355, partial [Globisporangium splendens]